MNPQNYQRGLYNHLFLFMKYRQASFPKLKLAQSRSAERKMKVKFGVAFIIHESRHKNKGETECRTEGGAKPDETRGFLTSIHDYINNRES